MGHNTLMHWSGLMDNANMAAVSSAARTTCSNTRNHQYCHYETCLEHVIGVNLKDLYIFEKVNTY